MDKFLKKKIFHNTSIKIFSLIFAILFWTYVMDQVNPVITKELNSINVKLLNTQTLDDNKLMIMNNKEFFVDVIIEGRRDEVIKMKERDIILTADLMGYRSGMNVVRINAKSYNDEIRISEMSDDEIKIELEKIIERSKPVKIETFGNLKTGYKKNLIEIEPSEILVKGPESRVNAVESVYAKIDVSGIDRNINRKIIVMPVDDELERLQGLETSKKYIDFAMKVNKKKEVPVKLDIVDKTSESFSLKNYSYYPKNILIDAEGNILDSVDSLTTEKIEITDDLSKFSTEVELKIPENVNINNTDKFINIYGEVEPVIIKEYKFNLSNVAMINLNEEYGFDLINNDKDINLKLKGPKSVLDAINKNDIELQIDCEEFDLGYNSGIIKLSNNIEKIEYELSQEVIEIQIKEKTNGDE